MKERLGAHFGPGLLHETYGSTEAESSPISDLLTSAQASVRWPASRAPRLNPHPDGTGAATRRWRIVLPEPYLFNGYWGRPEATAEAFRQGWVTVGDLARRDSEGFLYIVDRLKDMVISGGINIYPREVEEVIVQHPGVLDAAVIGIPDEKWGEVLKAFVVRRPGAELGARGCWHSGGPDRADEESKAR